METRRGCEEQEGGDLSKAFGILMDSQRLTVFYAAESGFTAAFRRARAENSVPRAS